jgi:hypothetical protein
MKLTKSFLIMLSLSVTLGLFLIGSSNVYAKVLWMDTFDDAKIDAKYIFKSNPGKWIEKDGVVSQTNPAPADTCYLLYQGGFAEPHAVIVKVRIDDWGNHDLSRAGIGVRLTDGGQGYAFLIHDNLGNMEFLNDALAWKNNDTPPPFGVVEVGKWYWMKAEISDAGFRGKIWPEAETEPAKWLLDSKFDFGAVRAVSGNVGLNGGSNTGTGKTLVSYDNWGISDNTNEATPKMFAAPVEFSGKLSNTWGSVKLSY